MLQNFTYIYYTLQEKLIIKYWNFDVDSISKLFNIEMQQQWKQLQSSIPETSNFLYNV
jgi:hypothetical protein